MNKSEAIRSLAREGLSVADIARRVGVRYQFARNVLQRAGLLKAVRDAAAGTARKGATGVPTKPWLAVEDLLRAGFVRSSRWLLAKDGGLALLNALLKKDLQKTEVIDIYTVSPPDLAWNGLPVSAWPGSSWA